MQRATQGQEREGSRSRYLRSGSKIKNAGSGSKIRDKAGRGGTGERGTGRGRRGTGWGGWGSGSGAWTAKSMKVWALGAENCESEAGLELTERRRH